MPPKLHNTLRFFQNLISPKPKRHEINLPLSTKRFLSTITESSSPAHDSPDSAESPDLPPWLLNDQNPKTTDPEDDDFVIPSMPKWADDARLNTHKAVAGKLLSDREEEASGVEKLSGILKKHYPSPDKVVEALIGCGVDATHDLVSQILKRFSNLWIPAFGVFVWAKDQTGYVHTTELYDSMVDILGKCKKFSLMWELVVEMNVDGHVSLVTMSKVMRRLARAGKYVEAIDAFKGMEEFGLNRDINALNVLLDALVKEGSVEHAQSAFEEFKDSLPLDSHSFNILIHGFCKARKLDDARRIMDEMEAHGFRPSVVSYTCFVEAYCKDKDFRNVDAILDEMEEKGCSPNVITYTIVIHALGKAKQINEALDVYEKMKRNGFVPDSLFYGSFIYLLSRSGRIKDAWDAFEDMEKLGVTADLWAFNTMIASACQHSQEESALGLLQRMGEGSCKPNIKTYAPLLKMCCRKKNMKVLKFLLDHMFKNDASIDIGTYELLVKGLCKSGKLEHACFYFEESVLKGMTPTDSICKLLINELEGKNKAELKGKVEKLMLRAKEKIT